MFPKEVDQARVGIITRTANRISNELDRMVADLPEEVAPKPH